MTGRLSRSFGLALLVAITGGSAAFAQNAAAPVSTETPAVAPPAGSGAAAPTPTPAPTDSAAPTKASPSKGVVNGYAYKSSSAPGPATSLGAPHRRHLLVHHPNEAIATFTGFEMLADGGSRLFVQLSKQVDVGQEKGAAPAAPASPRKKAKQAKAPAASAVVSRLSFVLKGTEVVNPMNDWALVTVHFNTPVMRARLVPSGHDVRLEVELRADVTPQMKIVPAKDNGAMLQIDFAQGSYLPAGSADAAPEAPDTTGGLPGALPTPAAGANDSTGPK